MLQSVRAGRCGAGWASPDPVTIREEELEMSSKTRWTCAALLLALLALPAVPALAAEGLGTGTLDLWTTFSAWWQGLTSWVAAAETVEEPEATDDGFEAPLPGDDGR